MSIAEILTEF